jgi:hypothetical protein
MEQETPKSSKNVNSVNKEFAIWAVLEHKEGVSRTKRCVSTWVLLEVGDTPQRISVFWLALQAENN